MLKLHFIPVKQLPGRIYVFARLEKTSFCHKNIRTLNVDTGVVLGDINGRDRNGTSQTPTDNARLEVFVATVARPTLTKMPKTYKVSFSIKQQIWGRR